MGKSREPQAPLPPASQAAMATVIHVRTESNLDYVPPPVLNLQAQVEGRRRPTPAEVNRDLERAVGEATVEGLIVKIAQDTRKGAPGATAEATEASHEVTVARIRADMIAADARAGRKPQPERVRESLGRDAAAREESVDLIRAEMARSIHTEDYSG